MRTHRRLVATQTPPLSLAGPWGELEDQKVRSSGNFSGFWASARARGETALAAVRRETGRFFGARKGPRRFAIGSNELHAPPRSSCVSYEDLGFAKVDHHRELRALLPEVILAQGKTPEQVAAKADTSYTGSFLAEIVKPAGRKRRASWAMAAPGSTDPVRKRDHPN